MNETNAITTVDAVIFGFLLKKSMSAYDLAQTIHSTQVDRFLKISTPAVYKACKRLYAAGLLDATVVQNGDLPRKKVYAMNEEGAAEFKTYMMQLAAQFSPFYLDCNVLIWNLDNLSKAEGIQALETLRETIAHFKDWVEQHEKEAVPTLPFTQRAIIRQYRMTITALHDWCAETLEAYKKEG